MQLKRRELMLPLQSCKQKEKCLTAIGQYVSLKHHQSQRGESKQHQRLQAVDGQRKTKEEGGPTGPEDNFCFVIRNETDWINNAI